MPICHHPSSIKNFCRYCVWQPGHADRSQISINHSEYTVHSAVRVQCNKLKGMLPPNKSVTTHQVSLASAWISPFNEETDIEECNWQ